MFEVAAGILQLEQGADSSMFEVAAGILQLEQAADRTLQAVAVLHMERGQGMLPLTVASELRNMT